MDLTDEKKMNMVDEVIRDCEGCELKNSNQINE